MRPPTVTKNKDEFITRIRIGPTLRYRFVLKGCSTEAAALKKTQTMSRMARQLAETGLAEQALPILNKAAEAPDAKSLWDIRTLVNQLCKGKYTIDPRQAARERTTFRMLGERWTSGELHEQFPDHVGKKRSADDDAWRLERYVYPIMGDTLVSDVTLDDAERVMQNMPKGRAGATRRQIAQVIHRVMVLAVYPCRLISASPIPRGWLPKPDPKKAIAILYPDEDSVLLRRQDVPLGRRLAYGYLHREGHRKGEIVAITWADFDLERGVVRLDKNKTDHPRMWKLSPGVAAALAAWKLLRGDVAPSDRVFAELDGRRIDFEHLAGILRDDLQKAGITRAELFENSRTRMRFSVHGLRHSFVTRSLATGRTEDWVRLRTGHRSNELWRYREMARALEELELGDVLPLDEAIPELGADGLGRGPCDDKQCPTSPEPAPSLGQSLGQTLGQSSGELPPLAKILN